ncbi:MAG: UvrB/UvrC motif-containing protein, partial [Candidatus Micrarchaeota archaeon]|nr:UvrB/UvrC motif-containing protein [Candidatus Micrarchaeota archaeon]
ADKRTQSIDEAVRITEARRKVQIEYNKKYKITPKTIIKKIEEKKRAISGIKHLGKSDIQKELIRMDADMKRFAEELQFEKAIEMRDRIEEMKKLVERRGK